MKVLYNIDKITDILMPENLSNSEKTWPAKAMFGVLVFLAMATLVLGTLQLGRSINGIGNEEAANNNVTTGAEETEKTIEQLQALDTDGDGLSDFNELYVHSTSPYLKDSDSDSYPDKEEIDGGFDPNCPKGQDCRGAADKTPASPAGGQNTINLPTGQAGKTPGEAVSGLDETGTLDGAQIDGEARVLTAAEKEQLKQLTPAQLRELLLSAGGITEEQLNQISDDDLLKVVEEALGGG